MFYNFQLLEKEYRRSFIWSGVLFIAIVWTAIEAPYSFVMNYKVTNSDLWWDGLFCLIFLTDVILRINNKVKLPTVNHSFKGLGTDKEETPYKKTLWPYIDTFTSLPFDIIVAGLGLSFPIKVLSLLRLLRIVRIAKIHNILKNIEFLPRLIKIALAITGVVIAIHFIACGWLLLTPMNPKFDQITNYNIALYWTITTLTTVGYGDITPSSNLSRIYTMNIMLIGVASYGIIIGNFSRMIMLRDRYKEEKKEKMDNLNQFMRYYHIPNNLQRQVFSFYNHVLNKNISDQDTAIVNDLPHALQNELQIFMKIKLIKDVHIFRNQPISCLKMIASKLEQSFYSPNESIIKKGDVGEEMFIIAHGEVEVCVGEKVITNLKAGQFFGEIALLEDTIRTADVKGRDYCDLYIFKKSDFLDVIDKFPDLGSKFTEIYKRRRSDQDKNPKAA